MRSLILFVVLLLLSCSDKSNPVGNEEWVEMDSVTVDSNKVVWFDVHLKVKDLPDANAYYARLAFDSDEYQYQPSAEILFRGYYLEYYTLSVPIKLSKFQNFVNIKITTRKIISSTLSSTSIVTIITLNKNLFK